MSNVFKERVRAWVAACRPKTLTAACAPVAVGTAAGARVAADAGGVHWAFAACALVFALLVQITCNLSNDLGDFLRGADTPRRLGPKRMAAMGELSPRALRLGTALCALLAFAAGLPLAAALGWWLAPVGVLCLLAAFAYTNGPIPLAYNSLGDAFVLVFFGFVAVLFSAYVQCGAFPLAAWGGGLACGLLAVNILLVNNARDMETDAVVGKRTTVVRFGRGFARRLYVLNALFAVAIPPLLLWFEARNAAWSVVRPIPFLPIGLTLLPAPLAFCFVRDFLNVPGANPRAYNPLLGGSALLLLLHAALFAVALAWPPT